MGNTAIVPHAFTYHRARVFLRGEQENISYIPRLPDVNQDVGEEDKRLAKDYYDLDVLQGGRKKKRLRQKGGATMIPVTNEFLRVKSAQEDVSFLTGPIDQFCNEIPNLSNKIPLSQFENIYVTSDIHSDILIFIRILLRGGFITYDAEAINITPLLDPTYSDKGLKLNPDVELVLFNPILYTGMKWAKPNTLFVILGDLVDGARCNNEKCNTVLDNIGNWELLLHIFIFNLRIAAFQADSDVKFTIGNHDLSVINTTSREFDKYCSEQSQGYFRTLTRRKEILFPFYKTSPYAFLTFHHNSNNSTDEAPALIYMAHGGFYKYLDVYDEYINKDSADNFKNVDKNGVANNYETETLEKIQNLYRTLLSSDNRNINQLQNYTDIFHLLWSRLYSSAIKNGNKDLCTKDHDKFELLVLGHTITSKFNKSPAYEPCKTCVSFSCAGVKNSKIAVAHVDVGMARPNTKYYTSRNYIELLLIKPRFFQNYQSILDGPRVESPRAISSLGDASEVKINDVEAIEGGNRNRNVKKPTDERIVVNNRKYIVYKGSRGAKYIKTKGEFVSIKKLKGYVKI